MSALPRESLDIAMYDFIFSDAMSASFCHLNIGFAFTLTVYLYIFLFTLAA